MSSSHSQQPLMARPVEDLQAIMRGYDIENRELQQELKDCHQKLEELSSRPVVHAEFEPEPEPETSPEYEVSSIREAIQKIMITPGSEDISKIKINQLVQYIKYNFPELQRKGIQVNTEEVRHAVLTMIHDSSQWKKASMKPKKKPTKKKPKKPKKPKQPKKPKKPKKTKKPKKKNK